MSVGLMIELLVAFLLVLTIGYCVTLNRRLKRLRNDEEALRATIAELITATEIAERAILGLKATAGEADKTLAHRLMEAERLSSELQYYVSQGDGVVGRLVQISEAVRNPAPAPAPAPAQMPVAQSMPQAGMLPPEPRGMRPMTNPSAAEYYGSERDYAHHTHGRNIAGYGDLDIPAEAPMVDNGVAPRRLKDVAAATSERLMAIRQRRGVAA
ncbi:DUF6468 domain-containing protein [Cohaesibacter gelatinilyticus]|uniref:DUF6468 domain-containing protein n=1 Tax=Cohaesibacter gelatinilyticus TaxID=372072 RepID=A0A285NH48_9HYPH|nr:DUF6468 domain-containing protein [Cohaesibacter gelatinilyticus]SNZ08804.1 hypothetical protein SAMN06265368_1822 [Cohaesibacter gelatinilyticus]